MILLFSLNKKKKNLTIETHANNSENTGIVFWPILFKKKKDFHSKNKMKVFIMSEYKQH